MHPTQKPATTAVTDGSDRSPAETLRSVAHYLDQHGWTQHTYYGPGPDHAPSACLLGATGICVYGRPVDDPESYVRAGSDVFYAATRTLIGYLDDRGDFDSGSLGRWNDEPGRTVEQVVRACRDAADGYDRRYSTGGAA